MNVPFASLIQLVSLYEKKAFQKIQGRVINIKQKQNSIYLALSSKVNQQPDQVPSSIFLLLKSIQQLDVIKKQVKLDLTNLEHDREWWSHIITHAKQLRLQNQYKKQVHIQNQDVFQKMKAVSTESKAFHLICPSCNKTWKSSHYIKHIETCFFDTQVHHPLTSEKHSNHIFEQLVLPVQTQIIHCNYFDPKSQVYCKQLMASCPHTLLTQWKQSTKSNIDVPCAYPIFDIKLSSPPPYEDIHEYCRSSRSKCEQHFNWELIWKSKYMLEYQKLMLRLNHIRLRRWTLLQRLEDIESIIKRSNRPQS